MLFRCTKFSLRSFCTERVYRKSFFVGKHKYLTIDLFGATKEKTSKKFLNLKMYP